MDYRSIYSVPGMRIAALCHVAEGASIPATAIRARASTSSACTSAAECSWRPEALRFQKLDLFSVMLRCDRRRFRPCISSDAVNVLRNGDGNDTPGRVHRRHVAHLREQGTLTYALLVGILGAVRPSEMNTMLVSNATMVRLLKLTELQNPLTGLNFQGTAKFGTLLGASSPRTQAMADGCILARHARNGRRATSAWNMTLIDQLERAAITSISGFGKICTEAAKVLEV